jgi:hypothetical protein
MEEAENGGVEFDVAGQEVASAPDAPTDVKQGATHAVQEEGGGGSAREGGAVGDKRYATSYGYLTGFMWPKVDATDAKPMPCGFKLKTGQITESTIA